MSDGQKLFLFNPDSSSFEGFFETSNTPKLSPDFKKAAYYSNYEIWLLFLKAELGQPQKEAGQQVFIARFSEKIDEVFWLTAHYLVFNSGGKINEFDSAASASAAKINKFDSAASAAKIKIAEIDDRDVINIIDLANFESPKIFWSQNYKKLFILSLGNLYSSKELVP